MIRYYSKNISEKGVAALPVILLISAIAIELVVAGAFIAFSFASGSYGTKLATEAMFGARAGADDAMYRIIKNNYNPSYNLDIAVGSRTVNVNINIQKDPVDLGACAVSWGCRFRVLSKGKSFIRERQVELILSIDPINREIRKESFKEIEI